MIRRVLLVLLVVSLLTMSWGCKSSAQTRSGAAQSGRWSGSYVKLYQTSVPDSYNAAVAMLEQDKIPVYSKVVGPTMASIRGITTSGDPIVMDFRATGINSTEVTVKVGSGDVAQTNYLFEQLDSHMRGTTAVGAAGTAPGMTHGGTAGAATTTTGTTSGSANSGAYCPPTQAQ